MKLSSDKIALFHCCPARVPQVWVVSGLGTNLQIRLQFDGAGLHGIPGQSLSHHHRCLSDNLQRATGQCLRDIWSQQQQQRHGRLFSRSVTTERRWRRAACSRSPAPSSSRDHLSQVASGQASTCGRGNQHCIVKFGLVWFGLVWFG